MNNKRLSLQEKQPEPKQTKRTQMALKHRKWLEQEIHKYKQKLPNKKQYQQNDYLLQQQTENNNIDQEEYKEQKNNFAKQKSHIDGDTIVCVRQRPFLERELNAHDSFYLNVLNNPKVHFFDVKQSLTEIPQLTPVTYNIDYAFDQDSTNDEIYELVGKNVVQLGLKHGLGMFLAYGQTGSGKTYTMTGIIQNIARDIFALQKQKKNIYVTYIEIGTYGDVDLLTNRNKVEIKAYPGLDQCIRGNTEYQVNSEEEFHKIVDKAQKLRSSAPTFKNTCSSRSVAFLRLRIEDPEQKENQVKGYKDGEITIVDMPGSEYAPDRQYHNDMEAMNSVMINYAIIELKRSLLKKAEARMYPNKKVHVNQSLMPFLRLMRDFIEPFPDRETQIVFFSNISPSITDIAQTKNTLDYCGPLKVGGGAKFKDNQPRITTQSKQQQKITKSQNKK